MSNQWGMQDRNKANVLGNGRFLFNFTSKDDLNAVLRKEPVHYNYSMFVLVRWEPVVHDDYPRKGPILGPVDWYSSAPEDD